MIQTEIQLPDLNKAQIKNKLEQIFQEYRLFKYHSSESHEHAQYYQEYCGRIEKAVEGLPSSEQFLIKGRYLIVDAEYLTDGDMAAYRFSPPVSRMTYYKIQAKAFYKLALYLELAN